jgi:hypothetical protein
MTLPVSMSISIKGTTACITGSWGNRLISIKLMIAAGEKYWANKLIGEMNRELKAELPRWFPFAEHCLGFGDRKKTLERCTSSAWGLAMPTEWGKL